MARIRSIKPEFFRHRRLFVAEQESGLPLRVAFAGLWTVADREGRFRWEPDELKLDCLPYDDVDFSRVLDALTTRGFLVRYASQGREYGSIPGFSRHQVINNRETASTLPPPPEVIEKPIELTREPRVDDACPTPLVQVQGEGKGREGKGKDLLGRSVGDADATSGPDIDELFERFWQAMPKRGPNHSNPRKPAKAAFERYLKRGVDPEDIIRGAKVYAGQMRASGRDRTETVAQGITFLSQERWRDLLDAPVDADEPWKTDPRAWKDRENPPPWDDAPTGTMCGPWRKCPTTWAYMR